MLTPRGPPRYQVFLLCCWEERGERPDATVWRFSVDDPRTGHRHGFASLDALVTFLKDRFGTLDVERGASAKEKLAQG